MCREIQHHFFERSSSEKWLGIKTLVFEIFLTANRMLNIKPNNPSPLPFLVHCLIDIIIGWVMSISLAFKLHLSAVFFCVFPKCPYVSCSLAHHSLVHLFQKQMHSYATAFIYNDNLQFIYLNLVQFSKLSNISDFS